LQIKLANQQKRKIVVLGLKQSGPVRRFLTNNERLVLFGQISGD